MKKVIEISNLEFRYPGQSKLLTDLSLTLKTGQIHGLLGKNGEGKSTLLKLISGLLFPLKGNVEVLGFEPKKRDPKMLQDIFFLPEEIPESSLSIAGFERVYSPFYPQFSSGDFFKYMNEFTLDLHSKHINELSFGQKKKFYIAFGLATNARLILMDEPTNGLDIPSKRQFRRMVDGAINENSCIVISTHQVLDLDNLINNIIIMNEHEIIFNHQIDDIVKKLEFRIAENHENDESVIYSEDTLRGYCQVRENKTGEVSKLDVELLFNAVISDHHRIKELFHSEVVEISNRIKNNPNNNLDERV